MSAGAWVALITLGSFCVLSTYSYAHFPAPKLVTQAEKRSVNVPKAAKPVNLIPLKRKPSKLERAVLQANGHGAPDRIAFTGKQKRQDCGDDFVCLLAWAERGR